jgi:hypothetical protein
MNNPSELWKTFKSVERKEAGGNSEVKELIADFENIVKHGQDQGQCSSPNIDFENKIKQETLNIETNICCNPETDKPIIIGEIKSVLKMLKKENRVVQMASLRNYLSIVATLQ